MDINFIFFSALRVIIDNKEALEAKQDRPLIGENTELLTLLF
nr:MAG TPA: hypothetical protein [Caudoviricetes sp.]